MTRPKVPSPPRKPPSHKRSKRSPTANCALRWTARSSSAMSSLACSSAQAPPAFTMGDMELVKAVFGVPDTLLSSVQLKQRQGIRTETYAQEFFGQVSAVSPQADQKSRTFQIEVTIPNPKGLLKSGMVATLDVGSAKLRTPALVVPIEAVVSPSDGSKSFSVFVVTHQGDKDTVHRRAVQPGPAFGNTVSIVEGVSRGERVVTNGATLVNDGQVVRVIP